MTKFLISAVLIVTIAMAGAVYLARSRVPTYENALVLETAEVPGSPRAAFSYTVWIVSLGKASHGQDIMESHHVTGMGWDAPDTLVVKLWRNEHRLLDDGASIVIVPHVTPERHQ